MNRDPEELARKRALLTARHLAPLTAYVERLRVGRGGEAGVPWFDPTEAGTAAPILLLFEAPGPRAAPPRGSGFVSPDNDDASAENMWHLLREAGVDRGREVVTWNVVPWYLGDDKRIRPARARDLEEARPAVAELVSLLGALRVVVLFGVPAQRGWREVGFELPAIAAPHPSPQNLNTRPEARGKIRTALQEARRRAGLSIRKAGSNKGR